MSKKRALLIILGFAVVLVAVVVILRLFFAEPPEKSVAVDRNVTVESSVAVMATQTGQPNTQDKSSFATAADKKAAVSEKSAFNKKVHTLLQSTSLAGTQIDRVMVASNNGKIILNGELLLYFDYFLSLQGERDMAAIKELVWMDMQANYPVDIAAQLYDVFERYVLYLNDVSMALAAVNPMDALNPETTERDIEQQMQARHFSAEESEQLFSQYKNLLDHPSQAGIKQKKREEFQQRIAAHPEQLESAATEMYGQEAAQRFRVLQESRNEWNTRMSDYNAEKQQILSAAGLDDMGKQQAVTLLQERMFSEIEIRRVKALDRIAKQNQIKP